MKTLNYLAVFIAAIIFSISFNIISSGAQQNSNCPNGDGTCTMSGSCSDDNTSGGNSVACGDDCQNCKEACSSGAGSMNQSGGTDNNEQSSVVMTVKDCSVNGSCHESENCSK